MKAQSLLTRIIAAAVMCTFVPAVTLTPAFVPASAVAAKPGGNLPPLSIVGTGTQGSFTGTFAITTFKVVGGALTAVGTLAGTLTNTATGVQTAVSQQVAVTVIVPEPVTANAPPSVSPGFSGVGRNLLPQPETALLALLGPQAPAQQTDDDEAEMVIPAQTSARLARVPTI